MNDALVSLSGVVKRFGTFTAVHRLDLEIAAGEFIAIMGPSGCGKTTMLRMIAGLEAPTEGEVRIGGRPMNDVPVHERDTPMVWQSLALFPFLNARENVEFGLRMRKDRRRRTPPARRSTGWNGSRSGRSPSAMSIRCRADSASAWRSRARW